MLDVSGWPTALAIANVGAGRIYIAGEARALTAIKFGGRSRRIGHREGMHTPYAEDNEQYALNILHWLDGTLASACMGTTACSAQHRWRGPSRHAPRLDPRQAPDATTVW